MYRFFSERIQKPVVMITPGEYYASKTGEVLYTVVGSCIAACIYDLERKIGGLNHFMLPGVVRPDDLLTSELGRYGMFAMELLIGELIKLGGRREGLKAKIFGGGNILRFREGDGDVAGSNIRFAKKFMDLEGIPLVKEDTGGRQSRKILFYCDTDRVQLKRYTMAQEDEFLRKEEAYRKKIFQKRIEQPLMRLF